MKMIRLLTMLLAMLLCMGTAMAAPCEGEHTIVTDAGWEPTCSRAGMTEGTHCAVCGTTLIAQKVIPMLSHEYMLTPGIKAGFGYHKHHCKRCGQPWAIHCTLLDDNHCVTCEYFMTTLLAAEHTAEEVEATIAEGEPLIVITPLDAGDAVMQFNIAMYEAGEPINFTIEAMICIPLTDEEAAQIEAGDLVLHTVRVTEDAEEPVELEYNVADGQLMFRTAILNDYVLTKPE